MKSQTLILVGVVVAFLGACSRQGGDIPATGPAAYVPPAEEAQDLRFLTVLSTNDIHGGIEPSIEYDVPGKVGGMAALSGVVQAIREGVARKYRKTGGTLLVDAGDQFQGTLLSNFDEGQLVFQLMKLMKFDAVIPGNHDYDFGPKGWEQDTVGEDTEDKDPRGALKRVIEQTRDTFPLLSANTFYRHKLVDKANKPIAVDNNHCRPEVGRKIDWAKAERQRPEFLKPYEIINVKNADGDPLGVRVAVIGLDNPETFVITTRANAEDLCFRDAAEAYLDVHAKLVKEKLADVFVIVMHDGNITGSKTRPSSNAATDALKPLVKNGKLLVDLVVAGHTHDVNDTYLDDNQQVPFIQSGNGARRFGRVDLVWDAKAKKLLRNQTKKYAGVLLSPTKCDAKADFCAERDGKLTYEGIEPVPSPQVVEAIAKAREKISGMADLKLGTAEKTLYVHRYEESALGNMITDAMLAMARKRTSKPVHVALINASGIRTAIQQGPLNFEQFYQVLPFNNRAMVIGPYAVKKLVDLFKYNVTSCGKFGALVQSGLKVTFERDCLKAVDQLDKNAVLKTLVLLKEDGSEDRVLYDLDKNITSAPEDLTINIATIDFLANGGDKFGGFVGEQPPLTLDVLRKELVNLWSPNPPTWKGEIDRRYRQLNAPPRAPRTPR